MDINDRIDQIMALSVDDKTAINMLLSACADIGSRDGALLSVKAFDRAADHMLLYFKVKNEATRKVL